MTSTTSPNMGLIVPTVGNQDGPEWAQNVNADLAIIDQHTHAPGQGSPVSPAGMNINTDLPFNSQNATLLRSARFAAQLTPLALATDLGCAYVAGADLYFNDTAGNQVRITQGGSVAGSTGTITGLPSGTASASYNSGSSTFVFQSATNTPANIDGASYLVRELAASPNAVTLKSPTSLAASYDFILPTAVPAATSFLALDNSGNVSATIATTGGLTTSNLSASAGITFAQLAAFSGQQVSSSSSSFTSSSTSLVDVTNLTVTRTTKGGPVMLFLQATDSGLPRSNMSIAWGSTGSSLRVVLLRDGVAVSLWAISQMAGTTNQDFSGSYTFVDVPSAGTYTWKIQTLVGNAADVISFASIKLVGYEI